MARAELTCGAFGLGGDDGAQIGWGGDDGAELTGRRRRRTHYAIRNKNNGEQL
jgi:hypothetical protein